MAVKARNLDSAITKAEFAATFGVSESQLERLFQQGMPHQKETSRRIMIPMPAGRVWYHNYLIDKGRRAAAPKSIDEARLRKETALAEMAELDLAERQRETMRVADAERILADAFSRAAAKLTTFAARAAAASFGSDSVEEAERRIEPIVDEVREELRRADDVPTDDGEDGEDEDDGADDGDE